jgi:hypothetical protein
MLSATRIASIPAALDVRPFWLWFEVSMLLNRKPGEKAPRYRSLATRVQGTPH